MLICNFNSWDWYRTCAYLCSWIEYLVRFWIVGVHFIKCGVWISCKKFDRLLAYIRYWVKIFKVKS